MPEQADIDDQQSLLRTYRRTLSIYLRQRVELGAGYAPPGLIHGIDDARENIRRLKSILRQWGAAVEDLPSDEESTPAPPPAAPPARPAAPTALVRELLSELEVAGAAFQAQLRLREPLVRTIARRLGITPALEFEEFFLRYYADMSAEERYTHQRIRAQTATIHESNQRAREIARQLDLDEALPALRQLRQHLAIWLNKYDALFQQSPHICVLYVGVEEGVPFPSGIERQLRDYLAAQRAGG
jgi:hypothetical protein